MTQQKSATTTIPLLPLPAGIVLLPGVAHRLPVPPTRADIPALLASIYQQAAKLDSPLPNSTADDSPPSTRISQVPIACVPQKSPLIGPDGQLLLQDGTHGPFDGSAQDPAKEPVVATSRGVDKDEFFAFATSAKVVGFEGSSTGGISLVVEGTGRVRMGDVTKEVPHYEAQVDLLEEDVPVKDPQLRELFTLLKMRSTELITVHISSLISRQHASSPVHLANIRRVAMIIKASHLNDAGALADLMVSVIDSTYEEKLQLLATLEIKPRVVKAIELIERQVDELKNILKATALAAVPIRIVGVTNARPQQLGPPASPRRPPMPARWDDGPGKEPSELEELHKKLCLAKLPPDAAKLAAKELRRLQKMAPANQEYQVISNWLETMAEIPWATVTPDRWDKETLDRARKQLYQDHYGLEGVKKRLIEYLAVLRLKQPLNDELDAQIKRLEEEVSNPRATENTTALTTSRTTLEELKARRSSDKSPILLLVGPPGVGKTSLAKSVATALGRKFHRISLGGVRDEAEIRGHRRTYVAAMPGILVQALRKVGVANPVILLDEIDKLSSSNHHGDPSAAMLEVLDPEQNHTFTDHFVGTPVDLSKALFIATANNLETIPAPLLDRLEIIMLPGYTTIEKRHIASQHLIPKQIRANGLGEDTVTFSAGVVSKIIESYTREAGVRNLEREIGAVCRAKAVQYAEAQDSNDAERYRPELTVPDVEAILGPERYQEEVAESSNRPGIVTGLVAYSYGGAGSILFIEIAAMPGDGSVQLTGQLGSVLQESVSVALSWVKGHAFDLGLTQDPASNIMQDRSIHMHCPSGAVPKDGPSSGIAQAIAMISLFSGKPVPPTLAMTGEISLRGRVMAVGGIKEKLIGALRAGIKTAIVPAQNLRDVADLPEEVKSGIKICHVSHVWEAIQLVWPDWRQAADHEFASIQSQL